MLLFIFIVSLLTGLSVYSYYLYSVSALSNFQLFGYGVLKTIKSDVFKTNITKLKEYIVLVLTFSLVVELSVYLNNVSELLLLLPIVLINLFFTFASFRRKKEPTKTPLVFTARVKRIVFTQTILSALMFF